MQATTGSLRENCILKMLVPKNKHISCRYPKDIEENENKDWLQVQVPVFNMTAILQSFSSSKTGSF